MVMLHDHVMSAAELTINVTEFKAKCLDLFDRLNDGRLSKVTVTRRGKPVAVATPAASALPAWKLKSDGSYEFDLEAFRESLGEDRLPYDPSFDPCESPFDDEAMDEWERNNGVGTGLRPHDEAA